MRRSIESGPQGAARALPRVKKTAKPGAVQTGAQRKASVSVKAFPTVSKVTKQPTTGKAVRKVTTKKAAPAKKATATTATTAAPAVVADPYAASIAAAEGQKFDPAQQGIEAQQRANTQRGIDSKSWFEQYRQQIAAANQAAANTGARVQQGMAAFGNAMTANDGSQAASTGQQMQADAASRGATVDPATMQTAINAAAVRRDNGASVGKLAGVNIEATAGAGAGVARNAAAQGVQSQVDLGRNDAKLLSALTDLGKQRGDFRVTQRAKLISDEQDAALKNYLATGKLSVAKTAATAKVKTATTAAQRDAYQKANGLGPYKPAVDPNSSPAEQRAAKKDAYQRAHHTGPYAPGKTPRKPGSLTPTKITANKDAFSKASIQASTYASGFKGDWRGLRDFLVNAKSLNPAWAKAAAQQAVLGKIDKESKYILTQRGVAIPTPKPIAKPKPTGPLAFLKPGA